MLGRAPAEAGLLNDGLETVVFSKDDGLDGAARPRCPASCGRSIGGRQPPHGRGRATDRTLLPRRGLVDRAIVVRAPVAFEDEPVPSGITAATLERRGSPSTRGEHVGRRHTCWTRGAHAPLWGMLLDEEPP